MAATRTVRDLVQRAMRVATILGAGETADADDASDALLSLNLMLDAWQADQLFAYSIEETTKALTAGVGTYTIGPAADIPMTPRPVNIEWAFTRDAQNYDRQIDIEPNQVYASIVLKSLGNIYPQVLFFNPDYPVGSVNLWPLPNAGLTLHLGTWVILTEYASLNDTVSVPPGYEDAMVFSLAERLCPEYGKSVSNDLAKQAQLARARVMGNNLPDERVACEFKGMNAQQISYATFIAGDF